MATTVEGRQGVWVFLVERGLDQASDLTLFWHEDAAIEAARRYLSASWSPDELATDDDVREAIEAANQLIGDEEYVVLDAFPIHGHQHFRGDTDRRPRCRACGEPIELDDPADPGGWIHCADANDVGDHTAER